VYRKSSSGIGNGVAGCPQKVDTFEVLEPYDGKLSCTVLRGVWAGNRPNLPDARREVVHFHILTVCNRGSFLAGDCVAEKSFLL
jgi:hypothetical protein